MYLARPHLIRLAHLIIAWVSFVVRGGDQTRVDVG
jgi:hypothetical protein